MRKKLITVLMISLAMLLVVSTVGCSKIAEIKDKTRDFISGPTPAAAPETASAPTPSQNEKAPAEKLNLFTLTEAKEDTAAEVGNTVQPQAPEPVKEPDLIIEDIVWRPLNPSIREIVTFTVTIKNQGAGGTEASQVSFHVDGSQKGCSTVSAIPAGNELTRSFNWRVESLAYTVKGIADYNNYVVESNEANNEKEIIFSGAPIPEPDLIIEDIITKQSNPSSGGEVTFIITVKNQGAGIAAPSQVRHYVDGSQLGSDNLSSIPAGGTATGTFTWIFETGNHVIKAIADCNDDVPENDETNNEKEVDSAGFFLADLIIESITCSPSNPAPSDTVTSTVTIKNQGNGESGPFQVKYYSGGVSCGTEVFSSVPPGGTVTGNCTWIASTGANNISAVVDHFNSITESDEDNNFKMVTSSVAFPAADLIIKEIGWSPLNPALGETVTFTVTIENRGTGNAVTSRVNYYVDGIQKGFVNVSSIPAGSTATSSFTWKAELGDHIIKAVADCNNDATESSETNNEKETIFSGTLVIDLIIGDIIWSPLNPFLGESFTFTIDINNQGDDEADFFQVYYYVDGTHKGSTAVSSIPAGGTATGSFTWKAELGDHLIKAVADYGNDVAEIDETNNEKEIAFSGTTVPKPDLIVESITWHPLNTAPGETVTFTITTKNQGSGRATSFWIYYYINGTRLDPPARVLEILPGDTWKETFTWTASPGTYVIKVVPDNYNQLSETDETNNGREVSLVVE